jgi:hypothetical protein
MLNNKIVPEKCHFDIPDGRIWCPLVAATTVYDCSFGGSQLQYKSEVLLYMDLYFIHVIFQRDVETHCTYTHIFISQLHHRMHCFVIITTDQNSRLLARAQ